MALADVDSVAPQRVAASPVLALLDCTASDERTFHAVPPSGRSAGRLYGGEVAAQAVIAAGRTVPSDRSLHSISAHFLRAGSASMPTVFTVDGGRDGRAFSFRSVEARQDGELLVSLSASFHIEEAGLAHQLPAAPLEWSAIAPRPAVVSPEDPERSSWLSGVMARLAVEMRFPEPSPGEPVRRGLGERLLLRTTGALTDDPLVQSAGLTYLSDLLMISAALQPHGVQGDAHDIQFATVSHSVWFHRSARADDWLLYDIEGTWAGGGRGLSRGQMFDRRGRLCASSVQEALLRVRR